MKLDSVIEKIQKQKILIIGDVGLDEYVNGHVRRISPEAPVPIVEVNKEEQRLGLAANVAQNISAIGGVPLILSVVGKDYSGDQLKTLLKKADVSDQHLLTDSSRPTTKKIRVMSEHHHVVRVDFEERKNLSLELETQLIQKTEELLPQSNGLILQDYAKGIFSKSLIQKLIALAKKHAKRVIVDPHRTTPVEFYRGADLMTPNSDEALALIKAHEVDFKNNLVDSFREVGRSLMKAIQSEKMVITRGKDGMSFFEDGKMDHVPTFARQVFDVTGAGDTVIAILGLCWFSGIPLKESCILANHAAGVVVGKIGCGTCSVDELKASLESHPNL